ncbi:MAG: N-acetylmuramoyl-L-alanine amidase, partial [Clostridia bacterium]|nr:N-acetylmuramoyl-L-alanine amidase [Clostridia bacterium]
ETPGATEHHTGLAVDIKFWDGTGSYSIGTDGAATESRWLAQNAHRFGFIARYTKDKADLTGKEASADHYRYVGIVHASYMYTQNLCLEEYLDEIKAYGPDNRLVVSDGNNNRWSIYYVAANPAGDTKVILPKGVSYELSGNNRDGFIVSVKSAWEGAMTEEGIAVAVTGVTLDKNELSVKKGNDVTLSYTVAPENASNKSVSFSSSDEKVATVSKEGIVTTLQAGIVTITVTTIDGGFKASLQITVKEPATSPVIWLDAGHGCDNSKGVADVGAGEGTPFFTVSGGFYEADLNMQITSEVAKMLTDMGYTVLLTRDGYRAEHVTVSERAEEANKAGADVFVSIHANSADSPTANGTRIYHYAEHELVEDCEKLSASICKIINETEDCSATEVSPSTAEYAVLTHTEMPSILVETCFLTNQADAEKAVTGKWCTDMATAIAGGIVENYPLV